MTKIVDFVSGCTDMDFLESFYDTTLSALKDSQNERLWFKTNMKLAKVCPPPCPHSQTRPPGHSQHHDLQLNTWSLSRPSDTHTHVLMP